VWVIARMMQALLSSYMMEGPMEEWNEELLMLAVLVVCECRKLCCTISCTICRRGKISQVAVDNAMYSLSVVDRAISVCNLLPLNIGHPQKVITKPV
jgi:hypothetical protein